MSIFFIPKVHKCTFTRTLTSYGLLKIDLVLLPLQVSFIGLNWKRSWVAGVVFVTCCGKTDQGVLTVTSYGKRHLFQIMTPLDTLQPNAANSF